MIDVLCFLLQPKLTVIAMKNFIRILLKALVHGVFLPFSQDQNNVLPTGEKAMTSSTASMNQRHGTFGQCIDRKLVSQAAQSSADSAPASAEPSRSFIAVLLRCLSAPNA